jgi:hypothetical protein
MNWHVASSAIGDYVLLGPGGEWGAQLNRVTFGDLQRRLHRIEEWLAAVRKVGACVNAYDN